MLSASRYRRPMVKGFTKQSALVAATTLTLTLALGLAPAVARADMGPNCHCSTPQQRGGRVALVGLIGGAGVAALLIERRRRPRRS